MAYTRNRALAAAGLCATALGGTFYAMQSRYQDRLEQAPSAKTHDGGAVNVGLSPETPLSSTRKPASRSLDDLPEPDDAVKGSARSPKTFDPTKPPQQDHDAKHEVRSADQSADGERVQPTNQRPGGRNPETGAVDAYTKKH